MNYSCDYCNKLYKRKYHFDRHVLACRVISISRGDLEIKCQESADIFTPEQTSKLIMDLYKRVTDAETRLRQITVAERKKINILEWLNKKEHTPEMPFYEWLQQIVIDNCGLELIFTHDYIEGMLLILEDHLSEENIPIKAFDKKSNQLYIYTDKWILASAHEFNKFLGTMSKKIMSRGLGWNNENIDNNTDNFADNMPIFIKKLNGGNFKKERISAAVRKGIYNKIKVEIHNVIECEFV